MAVPSVELNVVAVLVAAVVGTAIGALWYSPLLFGKIWMKLMGFSKEKLAEAKKKGMMTSYMLAFGAMLIMSFILAHFIRYVQATTVLEGMQLGIWLWLGFIVTVLLNSVLWEGKSYKLYALNVAHYFVVLSVMGCILAVWA